MRRIGSRTLTRLSVVLMPAWLAAASCSSESEGSLPRTDLDAGLDGAPRDDTGALDSASDAGSADAGPHAALEVVCATEPCYVSVSGNAGHHVCGLVHDGSVRCWGRDSQASSVRDGALGRGGPVSTTDGANAAPVLGLADVTQISVGSSFGTCARTSDGSVLCWGRNDFGQLGRAPTESGLAMPARVEGLPPVDEVRLGARAACAIASNDRAVYCWGEPMPGLGLETGGKEGKDDAKGGGATFSPRLVTTLRAPVKALAIGSWNAQDTIVALLDDDVLASAGAFPAGESSDEMPLERPAEIPGVAKIGPFAYLTNDGRLHRWRVVSTPRGQSVESDVAYLPSSAQIVDMKVSATQAHEQGGALLATGRLFRWGVNTGGSLGVPPDELAAIRHPLEMISAGNRVVSFATTYGSTCASLVTGAVVCWGANSYGELGRGFADYAAHPEAEEIE